MASRPRAGVGIIACVPPASGLLPGKYDGSTTFGASDHRNYNRHGEASDKGETFSGVSYDLGVIAACEVAALAPDGASTAQFALRWIADQPGRLDRFPPLSCAPDRRIALAGA